MKANEFVKKFGWGVATKLSKGVRGITESVADGVAGWGQSEWDKLKRLVESYELVESYGGLKESIRFSKQHYRQVSVPDTHKKLCDAIADVESCYD